MFTADTIQPAARVSVLVVEDDAPVRRSLQLLLRSHGFEVRAYASSRQALDDPLALATQCLIADFAMPDVDGLELLAGLRAAGWEGKAVLVSGFLTPEKEAQADALGFDLVLAKPLSEIRLARNVEQLTGVAPKTFEA